MISSKEIHFKFKSVHMVVTEMLGKDGLVEAVYPSGIIPKTEDGESLKLALSRLNNLLATGLRSKETITQLLNRTSRINSYVLGVVGNLINNDLLLNK